MLDNFDELKVCTAYKYRGTTLTEYPSSIQVLQECEPVYRTMEGWGVPLSDHSSLSDFPQPALDYLDAISEMLSVEIGLVSVGPERRRSIIREDTKFWEVLKKP